MHEHATAPPIGWTLPLALRLLRMAALGFVATLQTVWGRLLGKPMHPQWSILTEIICRTLRMAVRDGLSSLEAARLIPPSSLSPGLSRRVRHRHGELAGRSFESFTPVDWQEGDGVCLYLHGGGYAVCSPATHRLLVAQLAEATGLRCVSLDYRLAPEHAFPAALDDAVAAWQALLDEGIDPGRGHVGGDSAGGGLSAALLLRCRDEGLPMPRAAILLSPWVDLSGSGASVQANERWDYLPAHLLHQFADYYRGERPVDEPLVSPLRANLQGLPPMIVVSGAAELFASENRQLVEKAKEAGVTAQLLQAEAMMHVYPAVLPHSRQARDAFSSIRAFLTSIS